MSAPGSWVEDAACAGLPTGMFYPRPGDQKSVARAKRVCARCPVRFDCAESGRDERFGIWGGMTPRERNRRFRNSSNLVPAIGAARRLQALAALGYGLPQVAAELAALGVETTVGALRFIQKRGARTEEATASAIATAYALLVERGPNTEPRYPALSRRTAARRGWAGPDAWAGVNIDDPRAEPRQQQAAA